MKSLYLREIRSFLHSLIGYIIISVFLIITGLFLWVFPLDFNILEMGYANLDGLFIVAPFVFLFLVPAITMKSFAEEKRLGTIELLLTKPLSDLEIILAKFFADVTLLVISLIPTLIYYYSVYRLGFPKGNLDQGAIWGSYVGLLFIGAAFISIGIFVSSITDNQIISFVLSFLLCGAIYIGFEFIYSLELFGSFDLFVKTLGISHHYSSISRGVIDTRDIIYFLSLITLFILLSKVSLQSRKW
jgi:ABC-2 type transport system permease protein